MEYVRIAHIDEFSEQSHKTVKLRSRLVGIIRREDGSFFAVEAGCKHQGADLLSDYRGGYLVRCSRHQWEYDLETGECLNHDSLPLRRYDLKIEDSKIFVSLLPLDR